ncbi:putative membrane protein [Escherichia coli DEC2A]|nr:putative membrane protein [Escherichia coli DEC2A]
MGRWWRYKWITFHPSLTVPAVVTGALTVSSWVSVINSD